MPFTPLPPPAGGDSLRVRGPVSYSMKELRIIIREATAGDAEAVTTVARAAFEPLRGIYRPTAEVAARQPERAREGTRLVAEVQGRVAATVQFARHAEHVHVIGLAVHPDYQRRGIARRLLDGIAARAPSLGHRVIVLDTIKETGNVSIFEKLGFRAVGESVTALFESDAFAVLHEVRMERSVERKRAFTPVRHHAS